MAQVTTYSLTLANGQKWNLVGLKGSDPLFHRFASIMRLPLGNGDPEDAIKLIFAVSSNDSVTGCGNIPSEWNVESIGVPATKWKIRDAGSARLWIHPEVPHIILEADRYRRQRP